MLPHHHTLVSYFILLCLLVGAPQKGIVLQFVSIAQHLLYSAQLSPGKRTFSKNLLGTCHKPRMMGLIQNQVEKMQTPCCKVLIEKYSHDHLYD